MPERYVNQRDIPVEASGGVLALRLLLDRWSLEVFADRGLHAATCLIYAPQEHDGIRFVCGLCAAKAPCEYIGRDHA